MSLTDAKIKLAYRKLLFTDDTDLAQSLVVKKTSDQDIAEIVTDLDISISGTARYATTAIDGITIESSVTDLVDVTAAGSGLIITDIERIQYDEAYIHSNNLYNPHGITAADVDLEDVENIALTYWQGNTVQESVGIISHGVWEAEPIADAYIASEAIWNAKQDTLTFNSPSSNNSNPSTSAQIQADLDLKEPIHGSGLTAGQIIDWTLAAAGTINVDNYTNTQYVSSDFDHDQLTNAGGNQHIDWTLPSAGTVNADNYTNTNTTYVSSDFTHNDLTGYNTNEHIDWTSGVGGNIIHAANIPNEAKTIVVSFPSEYDMLYPVNYGNQTYHMGDIFVRTDISRTYIFKGYQGGNNAGNYTVEDDFVMIEPLDAITSVNGLLGDVVLTHDGFSDFVANEHIDWTQASVGTIDATNISELQGLASSWTDGGFAANSGDYGHTIKIQDVISGDPGRMDKVGVLFMDNIAFKDGSPGKIFAPDGGDLGTESHLFLTDKSQMGFDTWTHSADIRIKTNGLYSADTPGTPEAFDWNYRYTSLSLSSENTNSSAYMSFIGSSTWQEWQATDPIEYWNVGRDAKGGSGGDGAFVISYGNKLGFSEYYTPTYYQFLTIDEGTSGDITTYGKVNNASPTELGYLSGVTSGIQAQFTATTGYIDDEIAAIDIDVNDTDIVDTGKYLLTSNDDVAPAAVSWGDGEVNGWLTGSPSSGGVMGSWLSHTGILHLRRGNDNQSSYIALDAGSHNIMFNAEYDGGGSGNSEAVTFRAHMSGDVAYTHELASGNEILDWTQDLSATKTIPIANVEFTSGAIITGLDEEIQDIIGGMLTGTQSGITVTYEDSAGELDFDVSETSINHNTLLNYNADEHIDWKTAYTTNFMCGSARIGGGEGSRSIMIDNDSEAGTIKFEGVDQDAWETTLTVEEPTNDRVVKLPDDSGTAALTGTLVTQAFGPITSTVSVSSETVSVGGITTAGSITLSNDSGGLLYFEGATSGNTFVTVLNPIDPTAINSILIPNASGTLALTSDIPTVTEEDVTAHEAALSITESQVSDLGSYITGYTVSEGDVTGHQAALSITESQISDFGTYLTSYTEVNDLSNESNVTWPSGGTINWGGTNFQYTGIIEPNYIDFRNTLLYGIRWQGSDGTTETVTLRINTDPTVDSVITLPVDTTGTVALTSDLSSFITGYTVTEGDVTGHQAALSITESQVSDLGSYITDYTVTSGDVTAHEGDIDHDNLTNGGGNAHIDWTAGFTSDLVCGSINVGGYAGGANSIHIDNTFGGEIIWEGPDVDGIETSLRAATATTASKIITLPDETGTVALTSHNHDGTYLESFTENNDLSAAVTWDNIPIANVPTGTSGTTVALGDHNHSMTYLALAGGTMGGSINLAGNAISSADTLGLTERANHTGNLGAAKAVIYVNSSNQNLMYKTTTDEAGAGSPVLIHLEDDTAPKLSNTLDPKGNNILGSTAFTIGFVAESSSAETLVINAQNTSGAGNIDFATEEILPGTVFRDENDLGGATARDFAMASQASIKAYVDSLNMNKRYFTLTQQYYNCCSLDGRFYYRDTDSQNVGNNIGYLKWVSQDSEDPTDIGDTVLLRMPQGRPSGFGQIVPVDCKLLSVSMSWGNSAGYETSQSMYTMTCTPPIEANSDDGWSLTARDIWEVSGPGCDESIVGHTSLIACNQGAAAHSDGQTGHWIVGTYSSVNYRSFQYQNDMATTGGGGYTWDLELAAGDHVGLGIYSNNTFLASPSVTGSVTWFFEMID